MLKKNKAKNEILWVIIGIAFQFINSIVLIKLLTTYLEKETYGEYILFFSIAQFFEIGIFSSITQGASRMAFFKGFKMYSLVITHRWISLVLKVIIVAGTMLLIVSPIVELGTKIKLTILLGIVVLINSLRENLNSILHMSRLRKKNSISRILDHSIKVIVLFIIFNYLDQKISTIEIFSIYASVSAIIAIGLTKERYIKTLLKKNLKSFKLILLKRNILQFAWPFCITSCLGWAISWGDRWVLNEYFDKEQIAIYSLHSQVASMPFLIIAGIISTFIGPIIYKKYEEISNSKDLKDAISLGKNSLSVFLLFSISVFLLGLLLYKGIIQFLANSSYILNTSPLFGILMVSWFLFHASNLHASLFLYASGDSKSVMYSNLIVVMFYFPLILSLIENQGVLGASISFLIINILKLGFQIVFFSRLKSKILLKLNPL